MCRAKILIYVSCTYVCVVYKISVSCTNISVSCTIIEFAADIYDHLIVLRTYRNGYESPKIATILAQESNDWWYRKVNTGKTLKIKLYLSINSESLWNEVQVIHTFIQSFIPDISSAPLQVHYYSEALQTTAMILSINQSVEIYI